MAIPFIDGLPIKNCDFPCYKGVFFRIRGSVCVPLCSIATRNGAGGDAARASFPRASCDTQNW